MTGTNTQPRYFSSIDEVVASFPTMLIVDTRGSITPKNPEVGIPLIFSVFPHHIYGKLMDGSNGILYQGESDYRVIIISTHERIRQMLELALKDITSPKPQRIIRKGKDISTEEILALREKLGHDADTNVAALLHYSVLLRELDKLVKEQQYELPFNNQISDP